MTVPDLGAEVTWLGHATFLIETAGGARILVDPWVRSNPACPEEAQDVGRLDLILCTHGHDDHIGDVVEVAGSSGGTVVGMPELNEWLSTQSVTNVIEMNKGGTVTQAGVAVTMVQAQHSSSFSKAGYMGEAAGYVIRLENGRRIYHAGDTNVFGDMRLIGELYPPDLALLPIGGHYTMDPREAAHAVRLLGVDHVIGMHYGTFPVLTGTPVDLERELDGAATVHALQPGETLRALATSST